jgi:hypothetical protein
MNRKDFIITDANRADLVMVVVEALRTAPNGYVLTIAEPDKSRLQEKKYHAMIADIASCCYFRGRKWRPASWKRLLVEAYVNVERDQARASGAPDPFPGAVLLIEGLDGNSIVALGEQTRTFSKEQSAAFVESLYAYGAENGVTWSTASKNHFAALRRLTAAPPGAAQQE